jgi:predicted DNA-binding WGR domain protein
LVGADPHADRIARDALGGSRRALIKADLGAAQDRASANAQVPPVCSSVCSPMPDDLRSPIKHHLVPHRIDPEQGLRRFYSLMIKRDLFGTVCLMRNWGWIGTNRQELVEVFADGLDAGQVLEAVARAKR